MSSVVTFPSKVSVVLAVVIFAILGFCTVLPLMEGEFWASVIMIVTDLFVLHIYWTTDYTINPEEGVLKVRSGFFVKSVDIARIRKIERTNSLLSSPALSNDRIAIFYNAFDSVLISPKDQQGLVDALRAINPGIVSKLG